MRTTFLVGLAVCGVLLISCSSPVQPPPPPPPPAACAYTISPLQGNVQAGGGTGNITVTASSGSTCTWNAKSDSNWLTLSKASGSGSDSIGYTAAANATQNQQTATVTLTWDGGGPASATVVEAAASAQTCTLNPSSASQSAPANGGPNQFQVNASAPCGTWQAVPTVPWIHISSPSTGTGNQIVNYTVDQNPGASRLGGITVTAGSNNFTMSIPQDSGAITPNFVVTSATNRANNNCDLTSDPAIKCTFDGSSSTGTGIASYQFFVAANDGITVPLGTGKTLPSAVSVSCNNVLNKIVAAGSTAGAASFKATITLTLTPTTGPSVTSSPQTITLFFGATRPCGL